MTTRATGRDSDQLLLRLPAGMKDRIAEAARASGRSMTAEVVRRLESTFVFDTVREAATSDDPRYHIEEMVDLARHMRELGTKFDALSKALVLNAEAEEVKAKKDSPTG